MECITCNALCFVVIILIFSSSTFGIWTRIRNRLPLPTKVKNLPGSWMDMDVSSVQMTCVEWITFYGFKTDDYAYNKYWVNKRDFSMDLDVSTWAAMYAFAIGGSFYENDFLPQDFCRERGSSDEKYPFLKLQNEKRTCEDWIYLYGYSPDDDALNRSKAIKRDTEMDEYTALWADGYARFICKKTLEHYILPAEYCRGIGKTRRLDLMPFVDRKGSLFSCEGWNDLFDFTANNLQDNYENAKTILIDKRYETHVHYWVRGYAAALCRRGLANLISPKEFCESHGLDLIKDFYRPIESVKMLI